MLEKRQKKLLAIVLIIIMLILAVVIHNHFFATQKIKVYFANKQATYLIAKTREVKTKELYTNAIKQLINGPRADDLVLTIPPQTKLLGIELSAKKAVVNLSKEFREEHWGGTAGETMTVYSLVNTLTQFDKINEVKILIGGEEITTLAGHMELEEPLSFNSKIIKSE